MLNRSTLGAAGLMYGIYGAGLIWLGIGSMLCRRWARAVLLVLSWSWLLAGVVSVVSNIVTTRALFAKPEFSAGEQLPMLIMLIISVLFFVVIPGAMVLFYRSPLVAATCVARDPAPRWTDRCPLPVLACSLWFGICALFMVIPPIIGLSIIPVFGRLLTGTPAAVVSFAFAALSLYLAWATYRLKPAAWWVMLIASAALTASAVITFQRVDFIDIYRKLGFPDQVTRQLQDMRILTSKMIVWWAVIVFLLFVVYLIWIRKYFRTASTTS
jgi:hypothetical protein